MKLCTKCKQYKEFSCFSKDSRRIDKLQLHCKLCNRAYVQKNLSRIKEKQKAYRVSNFEKITIKERIWYQNNKRHVLDMKIKYKKKRFKEDILFRLKFNLSRRIAKVFSKHSKNKKTLELLGCSPNEAKQYLESLFQPGMTWENYGKDGWEIDHIHPLSLAKTTLELENLCHFSNLQPLWAKDNRSKGNRIEHNLNINT